MKSLIGILIFFNLLALQSYGQLYETNPPDYIKTITFKGNTAESQLPILRLGDPLILEFDALNGNEDDFYYEIQHYNYDWTPSILLKNEYLSGLDSQRIRDYENSFNTYQIYSHYRLQIPNQQTRGLLKSGNYLLSIFNDNRELVFTRKFMVYEDLAQVGVVVKRLRDVKFIQEKQAVDFIVNTSNFRINNPLQTINTMVIQNNNLNSAIVGIKPQYTLGSELIYRYVSEISFFAGNEFLLFANKDIRAANVGIQAIDLQEIYHNYLFTDIIRADRPYTYNPDINGNFVITALNARDLDIEADYAMIHFSLKHPELTDGSRIFVYGGFNNYALQQETELLYNNERGLYETAFKLKQGFYNYKYVLLNPKNQLIEGEISGDFWQTENNYKVLVYYRDLGARYDRIIGFGEASSVNITN